MGFNAPPYPAMPHVQGLSPPCTSNTPCCRCCCWVNAHPQVSLLPLRLKLDQELLAFLSAFAKAAGASLGPACAALAALADPLEAPPYFQRAEVRASSLLIDYRPRHVDIGALCEGSFLQLLNLVPWGGLDLHLKVRERNHPGW